METARTPRGEITATISREAVKVLRDYTGRGPTRARTIINGELAAIIFADTLTKGETRLVEIGKGEHVLQTRREYQRAMREELVGIVEEATGRKVIAFMSDNHLDPDMAVEIFVLEPDHDGSETKPASADQPAEVVRPGPLSERAVARRASDPGSPAEAG